MAIKKAYLSQVGRDFKISPHFTLGEFASKDGADLVKYSTELLAMLEVLRGDLFTATLNSAYRTEAHNRAVGGASSSQHIYGTAVDLVLKYEGKPLDARYVCCRCQSMGFPGVAYISSTAVHLDARAYGTYRGDERKGYRGNVGGDFYRYFDMTKAEVDEYFASFEPVKEDPIEEEEEMVYKDITEVPEWGQAAVQLRLEHGWTDGQNLTESMVRAWVVEDRENPYIKTIGEVPTWAVGEVQALIDSGKIRGNGVEQIGKRWQVLEALIMANR